MKTKNKNKDFDAVKMMREIRSKINEEIKDMNFSELREYIDKKLQKKSNIVSN